MDIFSLPLSSSTLKPGSKQKWGGLSGSALGLAIANCAIQFQGLTLVITENSQQAERLRSELDFFTGHSKPGDGSPEDSSPLENNNTVSNFVITEFPDWETLPYDNFSPHQDIISQRLDTLHRLPKMQQGVLIVPVTTLMHRLPPAAYIEGNSLMLEVGQQFDIEQMRLTLETAGYQCVESVYEHGEFTVRGSIMDIFPMGSSQPYRIELFDDEIESLRSFDAETQLSREKVQEIRLLPGKEYPLNQQGIETFRKNFRDSFDIDVRKCPIYEDISQGMATPGIEYYLPLFFAEQTTLFDFLPEQVLICTTGKLDFGAEQFWREITARYEDRCVDPQRPLLKPASVFLHGNELFSKLANHAVINLRFGDNDNEDSQTKLNTQTFPDISINQKLENPLANLQHFLEQQKGKPVLFCTDSPGRRETLLDLLKTIHVYPEVLNGWIAFKETLPALAITVAPIDMGLWLKVPEIIVITENQLFTHHVSQRRRRGKFEDNTDFIVKSLTELHTGAPVVHLDHGIGRYHGLQTFDVEGQKTEFLVLEYADQAKLYVPVSSLHLISRYSGADADSAPLHKLGNDQWLKAKRKAAEKIIDVAAELLEVYARRAAQKGRQFNPPDQDYQIFANSFPFEETQDQEQAIDSVISDMTSEQAMDRLICGDVGFGKTEVALRAAFIAINNNTQVAILVPTTLLAQQHFETFKDRFADWPVNIELMSRFVANNKQTENLAELENGKIDVVIGTHKLLQASIKYKNLGLLIIDEE
ncbi:DEAD/DEAH box helicase, partial [Gammaproteobacteria bacterium]|nr:DEAD/DEAH box helicase [Gammaproteobacteria bacterium]